MSHKDNDARAIKIAENVSGDNLPPQPSAVERLSGLYQFKNPAEVKGFLGQHPYLTDTLLDAVAQIPTYYGENAQLALEVVQDFDDGERLLFAFVRTALPVPEVLARRDRFDDEWWLDASLQTQGQLIFDVEFI